MKSVFKYKKGNKVVMDMMASNFSGETVKIIDRGETNGIVEYIVLNSNDKAAAVLQSSIKGIYAKVKRMKMDENVKYAEVQNIQDKGEIK